MILKYVKTTFIKYKVCLNLLLIKSNSVKFSLILFLGLLLSSCRSQRIFQIECNSVSRDATYVVDITVESTKELTDLGPVKLNAIDGILFRGITGSNCVTQKPILSQSKTEVRNNALIKAIYGKKKGYNKYITNIAPFTTTKLTNGPKPRSQYKYRITINKDLLRKDLSNNGVIKELNSGF